MGSSSVGSKITGSSVSTSSALNERPNTVAPSRPSGTTLTATSQSFAPTFSVKFTVTYRTSTAFDMAFSSVSLVSASMRSPAHSCRPLHDDEARPLKVLNEPLRDDLDHDLVRAANAPAALVTQRKGERRGQVGGISRGERVRVVEHRGDGSREASMKRGGGPVARAIADAQRLTDGCLLGWPVLSGRETPVYGAPRVTVRPASLHRQSTPGVVTHWRVGAAHTDRPHHDLIASLMGLVGGT